jgi:hypothetical protein
MTAAVEWSSGIESAWTNVANAVPRIGAFLAILVIGLIVARIAARIVGKIASRLGVNRMVERAGLAPHLKRMGFTGESALARSVRFFLSFVALTTALSVFGTNNPVSQLINRFVVLLPRLVIAAVIIVITGMVARFVAKTLTRLGDGAEGLNANANLPEQAPQLASAAVWVIGSFAAIDQIGIAPNVTRIVLQAMLAAGVGIAIVAVGGGGIVPMRARWESWLNKNQRGTTSASRTVDLRSEDARV